MPVRAKLTPRQVPSDERRIAELISKGGSTPTEETKKLTEKTHEAKPRLKTTSVLIRLTPELMKEVDHARGERLGRISRNTWLIEAISEKLRKDQK